MLELCCSYLLKLRRIKICSEFVRQYYSDAVFYCSDQRDVISVRGCFFFSYLAFISYYQLSCFKIEEK